MRNWARSFMLSHSMTASFKVHCPSLEFLLLYDGPVLAGPWLCESGGGLGMAVEVTDQSKYVPCW